MNCQQIVRSLLQDYQFLQVRLILEMMQRIYGDAALFVMEMKKLHTFYSYKFIKKSEQVWQKQLISFSLRVNGYMKRNILDEHCLYLPQTSINFFSITCYFSTQSSFKIVRVFFANDTKLQTFSQSSAVGVCRQLTHSMMASISCSVMVRYYSLKNRGQMEEMRARVSCEILELGSDSIQVENNVISPFYRHFLQTFRQPPPNRIIFRLFFQAYKNISMTKFSTLITFLSINATIFSKQRLSCFQIITSTSSNIRQLQQLNDNISSSTIFIGVFYFLILSRYFSAYFQQHQSRDISIIYLLFVRILYYCSPARVILYTVYINVYVCVFVCLVVGLKQLIVGDQYNIQIKKEVLGMSRKIVLSAAERLAQLKILPRQKLPQTLKVQINLPNIEQIRLHYRPMCKGIGPSLQFIRKYGPSIKYYNPGLALVKRQDQSGPLAMNIQIFRKNNPQPITILPDEFKGTDQLLAQIRRIDTPV